MARIRSPKCAPFRKIELEAFTRQQAMNIARFQANVAGKARPRQMDADTDIRGNASRDWARLVLAVRAAMLTIPGKARFQLPHLTAHNLDVLVRLSATRAASAAQCGRIERK